MSHSSVNPIVTVLIPVKNGEKYLSEAIKSCSHQMAPNQYEIVIVDDGSTDDTWKIINQVQQSYVHIQALKSNGSGLGVALNCGLAVARGKYIARLDADDLMLPGRLLNQLAAFSDDTSLVVVGGQILPFGTSDLPTVNRYPTESEELRRMLGFGNYIAHPTVMFDKGVARKIGGYSTTLDGAEDYDLWLRFSMHGSLTNLSTELTKYRIHEGQLTRTRQLSVLFKTLKVQFCWTFRKFASAQPDRRTNSKRIRPVARFSTLLGALSSLKILMVYLFRGKQ